MKVEDITKSGIIINRANIGMNFKVAKYLRTSREKEVANKMGWYY